MDTENGQGYERTQPLSAQPLFPSQPESLETWHSVAYSLIVHVHMIMYVAVMTSLQHESYRPFNQPLAWIQYIHELKKVWLTTRWDNIPSIHLTTLFCSSRPRSLKSNAARANPCAMICELTYASDDVLVSGVEGLSHRQQASYS